MEAELDAALGYEKNHKGDLTTNNKRNGHSPKTLKSQERFCGLRPVFVVNPAGITYNKLKIQWKGTGKHVCSQIHI